MLSPVEINDYLFQLEQYFNNRDDSSLYQHIVDAPFQDKLRSVQLDLGIVVFLLVDEVSKTVDRIALSNTELAQGAVNVSAKPFHEIKIPLDYKKNYIVKAVLTGKPQKTDDWQYLFIPALPPDEARFNQAGAGIGSSTIMPLNANGKRAAMIFSYFQPLESIAHPHHNFMKGYIKIVENALKS